MILPTIISKEIEDRYILENNTLIDKDIVDIDNKFETEIGDIKQPDFYPQIKIKRWDNECNFSARLIDDDTTEPVISTEVDKIKYTKSKIEAHIYRDASFECENGVYEFEIVLNEKPKTNVITFSLEFKDLKFAYQPELTQEDIDDGCRRPDNIVGSYVVSHTGNPINYVGGTKYKTGKAFHIFRPKIFDSDGKWIWGELNIDENKKLLTVTIPQNFIDTAIYPIRHAAGLTLGYTSTPGSAFSSGGDRVNGSTLNTTASATGTVQSVTCWLDKTAGTLFKGLVYDSSGDLLSDGATPGTSMSDGKTETTATYSSEPSVTSANDYYVGYVANGTHDIYYDSPGGTPGFYDLTNSYTSPESVPLDSLSSRAYACYATYTEASTDPEVSVTETTSITEDITNENILAGVNPTSTNKKTVKIW